MFTLCAAFAPVLLDLLREESGGFHLVGASSTGKTTALRVAASVWGGDHFILSWRSTVNGLEAVAAGHRDSLLVLDEIGQVEPRDVGEIIYMLANGVGKTRASKSGGFRRRASWRLLALSTGEVGLADHIRDGGKVSKAGQQIRLIDIPAEAEKGMGLFERLHGAKDAPRFAEELADAARTHHGVAIVAYLEGITSNRTVRVARAQQVRNEVKSTLIPKGANGQVARVGNRFALVAAAGALAVELGVLPCKVEDVIQAARACFDDWIRARGGLGCAEREAAIARVRAFIEAHGQGRFAVWSEVKATVLHDGSPCANRAGFRRNVNGERDYAIFREVFRNEVCQGMRLDFVVKALRDGGFLRLDSEGKSSIPVRLPTEGETVRMYVVKASILEESAPSPTSVPGVAGGTDANPAQRAGVCGRQPSYMTQDETV
jgi:uncharacterized protein (DUF927 family)